VSYTGCSPGPPACKFLAVNAGNSPIDHTVYGFADPDPDLDADRYAHVALRHQGTPRPGQMERLLGAHANVPPLNVHDPSLAKRGFPVAGSRKVGWPPGLKPLVPFDKVRSSSAPHLNRSQVVSSLRPVTTDEQTDGTLPSHPNVK